MSGRIVLEALYKLGAAGATYLVSCTAEAQRLGKTRQVMSCLQQIIVIIDGGGCEGLHIPTLFQYVSFVQSTDTNVDYLQIYDLYHVSGT